MDMSLDMFFSDFRLTFGFLSSNWVTQIFSSLSLQQSHVFLFHSKNLHCFFTILLIYSWSWGEGGWCADAITFALLFVFYFVVLRDCGWEFVLRLRDPFWGTLVKGPLLPLSRETISSPCLPSKFWMKCKN